MEELNGFGIRMVDSISFILAPHNIFINKFKTL